MIRSKEFICAAAIALAFACAVRGDDAAKNSTDARQNPAAAVNATQPGDDAIDWKRVPVLLRKQRSGQPLAQEELDFIAKAQAARRKLTAAGQWPPPELQNAGASTRPTRPNNANSAPLTPHESTGLIPITQMKPGELYKGQDGGLYGNCSNNPPADQEKRALDAAGKMTPLDASGNPAKDGSIVMISIGISNTTMEFSHFINAANQDPDKNPQLKLVDCAHGGRDAQMWADPNRKELWDFVEQRLQSAGAADQQVQACWIKLCLAGPEKYGDFPKSSDLLRDDIITVIGYLKARFPNLKLAYLSSRTYGGYCLRDSNPEPFAYEGAFAVRGVIQEQIKGNPKLTYDRSPVVLWGPYLWADGVKGRAMDDLVYKREDYLASDGTHPTESGKRKITAMLLYFFKSDPTSRTWFCREGAPPPVLPDLK